MTATAPIAFRSRILRPATPKNATWTFLLLPKGASARLPTRGMTGIEGRLEGRSFKAVLEPDGKGSHWLKLTRALREAVGASVGDEVGLEIVPSARPAEPRLPADLRDALASTPEARSQWRALTPAARRDWVQWLDSAKKAETRARRVASSIDMLVCGKRRVCCFDRSGIYSGALGAPEAAS